MVSNKHGIYFWVWSAVLLAPVVTHGAVEISEFMAKNESTLVTDAGIYADWVEIHNDSGSAVDLAGCGSRQIRNDLVSDRDRVPRQVLRGVLDQVVRG